MYVRGTLSKQQHTQPFPVSTHVHFLRPALLLLLLLLLLLMLMSMIFLVPLLVWPLQMSSLSSSPRGSAATPSS
jgi:hypothetical protein